MSWLEIAANKYYDWQHGVSEVPNKKREPTSQYYEIVRFDDPFLINVISYEHPSYTNDKVSAAAFHVISGSDISRYEIDKNMPAQPDLSDMMEKLGLYYVEVTNGSVWRLLSGGDKYPYERIRQQPRADWITLARLGTTPEELGQHIKPYQDKINKLLSALPYDTTGWGY